MKISIINIHKYKYLNFIQLQEAIMSKSAKALILTFSAFFLLSTVSASDVFITEIADPQNSSTAGRFVELYNSGSTDIDLSTGWALQRWTNGNADPQSPDNLTGTISAGGFYVICNDAADFLTTYGFAADQDIGTGGPADSNGDDNIALLNASGTIVDMFGVAGEDGSGTGHEFEDGRAERIGTVTSGVSTWDASEWNIDNDSGGGDGNQYAPEDFDPAAWIGASTGGNNAPIVNAGSDQEIMASSSGTASVTLDGSGTYDLEGDAMTYSWVLDGTEVSTAVTFTTDLAVGVHTFTLTANDGALDASDDVVITVTEFLNAYAVTFNIDMSLETVDGEGVRISGLADTLIAMSDDDANGIYTVTVDLFEGDHTYNFRNDWSYESGDSLGACASGDYGNDRSVTVVDADVVLDTVCWELCVACPVDIYGCTDPSAANYDPNATIDDGSCLSYPAIIPEGVIVINEIHYNPSSTQGNDDTFEFLELYNTSNAEVDLSFTLFTEGINHVFEYGTTISAGGYLVLAKDSSSYPGSIEWESGNLGNGGEDILLANGVDSTTIDFMDYDDGGDWPSSPDGDGPSLELIDPTLDNTLAENWQASYVDNGTPGAENSSDPATPIISISPDSLNFTISPPDSEQTQTLTISNTGDAPLEVNLFVGSPVVDIDGNVYQTVQIGDQVWMAENLKVSHYRNGDAISTGHSDSEWQSLSTGAYAVYEDNESNADTYGYLYNWYAVDDSRNIAPEGWHIPTDAEWKELEMYLGMSQSEADDIGWRGTNEGSKLAGRADLWNDGGLENNAEFGTSGFTALPGGYRYDSYGYYYHMGNGGSFWSSTEYGSSSAWLRSLSYDYSDVRRYDYDKQYGFSVRCVRDLDNLTIRQFDYLDESKNETHLENYARPIANTQSRSSRTDWLTLSTDTLTIQPGSSADVTVTVNAADLGFGTYSENISITSNDTANSLIVVPVTMTVDNSAPFVFQPMEDVAVDEDADTLSLSINGVFDDADIINGDTLTLTAISLNTDLITIGSDTNEVPYMIFVSNANGETDVVVTATDLAGLSVNDTVHVTVNAVNDAPSSFALQSVTSLIMSSSELSTGTISFSWGESSDVDGDTVMYHFTGTLSVGTYSEQYDTTVTDTNYSLISYQSLYDLMFSLNTMTAAVEWDVSADDGQVIVASSNGPLTLTIDGSSLGIEDEAIPDVFALHQNYPNPFNPVTTLHYDLPENSFVNITIYDMLGRQIRTLVNQRQEAGFKTAQWNATNNSGKPMSAGVYLYQIQAGEFVQTKKMVLLK